MNIYPTYRSYFFFVWILMFTIHTGASSLNIKMYDDEIDFIYTA